MSTKATREALRLLGQLSDEASELVADADAEVKAIQRAAKAVIGVGGLRDLWDRDEQMAADTISSIAKEEP